MAIVWPCPLSVDAYVAACCKVEFPRPGCPSCAWPDGVLVGVPAACAGGCDTRSHVMSEFVDWRFGMMPKT